MITKICKTCGKTIIKSSRWGFVYWKQRKYCCWKCYCNSEISKKFSLKTRKKIMEKRKLQIPPTQNILLDKKLSKQYKMKMSEIKKGNKCALGNKLSDITKRKMSESRKNKQNPNWKGGITPINDTIRHSIEMRLWREAIFARDNWTCQKCKDDKGHNLRPHHIYNFADYPILRFVVSNGITFCEKCHREFHKIYKYKNNKEQLKKFLSNN